MNDIDTFTEDEKMEYQRAAEILKKVFGNNPNFGNALNCFVNEIIDRRKPKCKHPDIGYTFPDWEGLSHAKSVKEVIESFKYLWNRQFYCNSCRSIVYPKDFATGPKPE
jgi:hypothetical protein